MQNMNLSVKEIYYNNKIYYIDVKNKWAIQNVSDSDGNVDDK